MPLVPKHQPGQAFSALTYILTVPLQKHLATSDSLDCSRKVAMEPSIVFQAHNPST